MTAGRKDKSIDPFSERLLKGDQGLWTRWTSLRDRHKSAADSLFAGMAAAEFTDHELAVLNDTCLVNDYERWLMSRVGRPMDGTSVPDETVGFG